MSKGVEPEVRGSPLDQGLETGVLEKQPQSRYHVNKYERKYQV